MKKKLLIFSLLIVLSFIFLPQKNNTYGLTIDIVSEHNLDYEFKTSITDSYYPYSKLKEKLDLNQSLNITAELQGKKIIIESSTDLYDWSRDLSFFGSYSTTLKQDLASRDYVIGKDIDYSEQKAKRFMPIGYSYLGDELVFTGTFDGQGFEIKDLYFVVFSEYSFVDDEQTKVPSTYFSMFNYNSGTIENVGLINPIIDLENELPDLRSFSYLVGENNGTIQNVYVEDIRDNGGLRAVASQVTVENMKNASGIVHTNKGTFQNSYFAGRRVVNSDFQSFFHSEPLVYSNTGTINNLVYDETIYLGNPNNGTGALNLKQSSTLTDYYYYPLDGYPKLFGLEKDNGQYKINNALDLVYFTKLINLRTVIDGIPFNEESYLVTGDLDLNDTAKGAYTTPETEFLGSFIGEVKVVSGKEVYPQINYLSIDTGVIEGENVYYGLFSTFSGHFENIAFYGGEIKPNKTQIDTYSNSFFYAGFIAGVLNHAEIKNVYINGDIDFSSTEIGAFAVGSVAGEASGHVERVLFDENSTIMSGLQVYNGKQVRDDFYLGGIIGKTGSSKLILYNALNKADLTSISGNLTTTNYVNFHMGGVLGAVTNSPTTRHNIGFITNTGKLTANNFTANKTRTMYIGGVIGLSSGNTYDQTSVYGKWTNEGELSFSGLTMDTYVAGVLNSSHTESIEFVKIYSSSNLSISSTLVEASGLVNHLTNSDITISQAISSGNITSTVGKDLGLAVYINNDNALLTLNYVEVYNNFTITRSEGTTTVDRSFAGVTLHTKANYLNVIYGGNMNITSSGNNVMLWVSGITRELNAGYYLKNTVNVGNITVSHTSTRNLFVAGLVNRNLSGDLQSQDDAVRPRATIGIINSINASDIDVTSANTGNTFIGGLVTLNGGPSGGSIQDAVNVGNLVGRNGNTGVATPSFGTDSNGGVVTNYKSGINIGGVAAAVTNGSSRIYDTSNKGNVIGIAHKFVRSGGILAAALFQEFSASTGNIATYAANNLGNAILSNGINYGKVQAVTSTIGSYGNNTNVNTTIYYRSGSTGTGSGNILPGFSTSGVSHPTRTGTQIRPGINSSAGGVIGYGLIKMYRMINHGEIGSTDVAGGVVGATSVVTTTTVHINTAINYGDIRVIENSQYSSIYTNKIASANNHFKSGNTLTSFLYPSTRSDIRLLPEAKRGFGGVFGRLQRATGQHMQVSGGGSFDFVVNMNPNIDLIGRLDQVYDFSSSSRFFNFQNVKYYSAKVNDTTQVAFTGYYYERNGTVNATIEVHNYQYETMTDQDGYTLYRYRVSGGTRYTPRGTRTANIAILYEKIGGIDNVEVSRRVVSSPALNSTNYTLATIAAGAWSDWILDVGQAKPGQVTTFTNNSGFTWGGNRPATSTFEGAIPVPGITETRAQQGVDRLYVYSPYFEMRDDSTLLTNGEPITSHIYYAERDLLATDFYNTRINGMYVLASSSGSNYGAVLPRNVDITALRKLASNAPNNLNYNDVDDDYLIDDDLYLDNLMDHYLSLYQTNLSDKSALLDANQRVKIKDKNYNTEAFYQADTFVGDELILTIDEALLNPANNFTLDFEILEALLPEGAIIAKDGATQVELYNFMINNPGVKIATGTLAPNLSVQVTNRNSYSLPVTITLGTFTSYSEAAIHDNNFTNTYKTEYTLKLLVDSFSSTPSLYRVRRDGGALATTGGTHTITNNFTMQFRESNANEATHKLKHGFVIDDFLAIYYRQDNGTFVEVEKEYYEIDSIPKAAQTFESTIYFSDLLRNGTYRIYYKFYEADTIKQIDVNYNLSRQIDFTEFKPYTSKSYSGNTADKQFDYDLLELHKVDGKLYERIPILNAKPYLANMYDYYIYFLEDFQMTDFFEFDEIDFDITVDGNGYVSHVLDFKLNSTTVLTKYIKERSLSPTYYRNNSSLTSVDESGWPVKVVHTTATREADYTIYTLDYKLPSSFYNEEKFEITYSVDGGQSNIVTDNGEEVYYFFDGRLNIVITKAAMPGDYEVNVVYLRDGSTNIEAGKLYIEKLTGSSGYLDDIKFSRFVMGAEYPDIYVTNFNNLTLDSSYELNVYYNGIDYDNSDRHGKQYFRIDGEVARIPLNDYMPYNIVDFLPEGAKIRRKYYEDGVAKWTDLVDKYSTEQEISASLSADFTLDPETGAFTGERVYIEYMVVPEDQLGLQNPYGITYFISVIDVEYTFLAVFNIWYKTGNTYTIIDHVPKFDKTLFFLNVYNYQVAYESEELDDSLVIEVNNFNTIEFDEILNIESKVSMFYFVDDNIKDEYYYQLGSNLSGYYQFKLDLPSGYVYKIYFNNYDDESNVLPLFNSYVDDIPGYFYYINTSSVNRTRYFHIVIEDGITDDSSWGFVDNQTTWD